jgi:site-specific DNA-methyltransferase (adenine-specific)
MAGQFCSLCGAWRGGFGSEPTPELYIDHSLEVLKAIKRVLKDTGVVWWNLGDRMATCQGTCFNPGGGESSFNGVTRLKDKGAYPLDRGNKSTLAESGLKPLDVCLIPFRFALAAQQVGWWVRKDIIWEKTNPMPESMDGWSWQRHRMKIKGKAGKYWASGSEHEPTEWQECPGCPKCLPNDGYVLRKGNWRPTEAHDYIFMLTKTDSYFCDREAVREPQTGNAHSRGTERGDEAYQKARGSYYGFGSPITILPAGRNLRDIWTFPTAPSFGDHFATFPEELPKRCIMASTSEGGNCSKCGMPVVRVVEKQSSTMNIRVRDTKRGAAIPEEGYYASQDEISSYGKEEPGETKTVGFRPSCSCHGPSVPAVVLDPFCGTGTTGKVAKELGRKAILIDISSEYCQMSQKRVEAVPLPLGI